MSLTAKECWTSLIIRYGEPRYVDTNKLNDKARDTLKLAIAERRALKTSRISDGCGGGDLYFRRARMDDASKGIGPLLYVFPRPCEITDEEIAALDHPNPWESDSDLDRLTCSILSPGCWKSLITRYGAPLEPEDLDEDILKLAIAEKRALKVIELRNYFGGEYKSGSMYFRRAEVGDAIQGYYMRDRPYFCIAFPRPCKITNKEAQTLDEFRFEWWEEVCKFTDEILRETRDLP